MYGYPPQQLSIGPYLQSHHSDVKELMQERVKVLQLLKENLQQAQHRMKTYADKKRSEREFQVGDEVFLKLQPHKQTSVALKKKIGSKYFPSDKLPDFEDETFKIYPATILARRLIPRNNVGVPQVLIQWSHSSPEQATWEDYHSVAATFPDFDPWGQGSKKARRSVALLNQNATCKERRTIRMGNEDHGIQPTEEIGGDLKNPSKDDVVSGELGRNRGTIEIGDS
ncbi:UNVERIFIED_CONTAM: hypothetical protein Sindi_1689900 [Sesamum indicum]